MKYPRCLKDILLQSFKASPMTLLIGPRQTGKIHLMREIAQELGKEVVALRKNRIAIPLSTLWDCQGAG